MDSKESNNNTRSNSSSSTGNASSAGTLTPQQQLIALGDKFKGLVSEAKSIGENTTKGKELLAQASKLYEAYLKLKEEIKNKTGSGASAGGSNASSTSSGKPGLSNIIRSALTPEQSKQYEKLMNDFQTQVNNIKDKHSFLKNNLDRLTTEINKQTDEEAKKQLDEKKKELLNNLKALRVDLNNLYQKLPVSKKNFYIECAKNNIELQKILQKTSSQSKSSKSSPVPTPPANPSVSSSASDVKQEDKKQLPTSTKNITSTQKQSQPTSKANISGTNAPNAPAVTQPVKPKLPPYEVDPGRVLSKRKLRELVKSIGADEGDGETVVDGDVEELLLDLADDFVSNVTAFALRIAKHRKSSTVDSKDIQLHLERNWDIRVPGYQANEIKSTRRWAPTAAYSQIANEQQQPAESKK